MNYLKHIALGFALIGVASAAIAAKVTVNTSVKFRAPLVLSKLADIDFGFVSAGVADTYTITPAGKVSAAGKGELLGGTPRAGNISIKGSKSQSINVWVNNYKSHSGVTLQNASCTYNGEGEAIRGCRILGGKPPGAEGKTLQVGVQAVVDGKQTEGVVATPSFDITVVYN